MKYIHVSIEIPVAIGNFAKTIFRGSLSVPVGGIAEEGDLVRVTLLQEIDFIDERNLSFFMDEVATDDDLTYLFPKEWIVKTSEVEW